MSQCYAVMLMSYLMLRRRGPKEAPRAHMGSPVWAASNHFTATSPETSKGSRGKGGNVWIVLNKFSGEKSESNSDWVSKKLLIWLTDDKDIASHITVDGKEAKGCQGKLVIVVLKNRVPDAKTSPDEFDLTSKLVKLVKQK